MNNEQQIREIVQEELKKSGQGNQYNVTPTSSHTHNGIDSQRVSHNNIIPSTTSLISLNTFASENLTLETIQGITTITLNGIAADNYDQAVTSKATISGHAQLGNCFEYKQTSVSSTYIKAVGNQKSFLQASNSMFIDTTDLTKTKVFATDAHLLYVADGAGNLVAQVEIIKWATNSITFQITLATHWQIFWYLSMS